MRLIDADLLKKEINAVWDQAEGNLDETEVTPFEIMYMCKAAARKIVNNSPTVPTFGEWIGVDDRLPDEWEPVLILDEFGEITILARDRQEDGGKYVYVNRNGFDHFGEVIYWMPLPEVPEKEEEKRDAR